MASPDNRLSRLEAQMSDIAEDVRRITNAVYGNGKPGLITELQMLKQSVEAHHQSVDELRKQARGDWKWIVTTLVAVAAVLAAMTK